MFERLEKQMNSIGNLWIYIKYAIILLEWFIHSNLKKHGGKENEELWQF